MLPACVSFGPDFFFTDEFVSKTFAPSSHTNSNSGLLAHGRQLMRTRSRKGKRNSRRSKGHSRNRNGPTKMKTLWRPPRTAKEFFAAPEQIQDRWISVANVVSRMRDRVSLTKASKEFGVEPSVVIQLGRPALR